MTAPVLSGSTGDPLCDRLARGVTGVFEQAFPGRVRGYYLRGSYASGSQTTGSDLDLFVVFADDFRDRAEAERAHALAGSCALLSPLLLELVVVSEQQLTQPQSLVLLLNLKRATRLLSGEDIRDTLPEPSTAAYVRAVVHTPYFSYAYPVGDRRPALRFPLGPPDPAGPWLGYDRLPVPGPDGTDLPSTKLLVASVGWTATALIALSHGRYVADKRACVELYRSLVADEWTGLVLDTYHLCRERWGYLLPASEADRRTLRALCEQVPAFANHFLTRYRDYLLGELDSGDPQRLLLATRRLGQLVFPDPETADALRRICDTGDPALREAAADTLAHYPEPG